MSLLLAMGFAGLCLVVYWLVSRTKWFQEMQRRQVMHDIGDG